MRRDPRYVYSRMVVPMQRKSACRIKAAIELSTATHRNECGLLVLRSASVPSFFRYIKW